MLIIIYELLDILNIPFHDHWWFGWTSEVLVAFLFFNILVLLLYFKV